MNVPEFVDTYSDDVIFLNTVRASLLRHPLEYHYEGFLDATLARLLAIMLVGSVENSIKLEYDRGEDPRLGAFLQGGLSNEKKIEGLQEFLEDRLGVGVVDPGVLSDYLAIKYLRNGVVHSSSHRENHASHIQKRGLPLDCRHLNLTHLELISSTEQTMTTYLGLAQLAGSVSGKSLTDQGRSAGDSEPIKMPHRVASNAKVATPFHLTEFAYMHKTNLGKVGQSWMTLLQKYPGVNGPEMLGRISRSEIDPRELADLTVAGGSARYSWGEIVKLYSMTETYEFYEDEPGRRKLLALGRKVSEQELFPTGPAPVKWLIKLREGELDVLGDFQELSHRLFGYPRNGGPRVVTIPVEEVLDFYIRGNLVYDLMANITQRWLWPLLATQDRSESRKIACEFMDLWEISRIWYNAIEHHRGLDMDERDWISTYRLAFQV